MLRIAAGPPQHLAKARVADAKALERVLAQRLAVLTLSARTEEALRAAMPRFAAVRALGKLLPAERKLSVLVARGCPGAICVTDSHAVGVHATVRHSQPGTYAVVARKAFARGHIRAGGSRDAGYARGGGAGG